MADEFRFLVDEDLSPKLATALRGEGFEAEHVQETLGKGTSDSEVLPFAVKREFIVVTNDRDFLRDQLSGETPIFYIPDDSQADTFGIAEAIVEYVDLVPDPVDLPEISFPMSD